MLARQQGRPQDPGIVAQCRALDANLSLRIGNRLRSGRRSDHFEIGIAERTRHSAADDDDLGTQEVDQASQANSQEMRRPLNFLERNQVFGGNGLRQVAALEPAPLA